MDKKDVKEQYFEYLKQAINEYCNSDGTISMYWDYRDEVDKNMIENYMNKHLKKYHFEYKEPTNERETFEDILIDQLVELDLDLPVEDEFVQYIVDNSPSEEIKNYISDIDNCDLINDLYDNGYNGVDWEIDRLLKNSKLRLNILLGTENERNYDMGSIVTAYGNVYRTPFVSYDIDAEDLDNSLTYLIHQQGYSTEDVYNELLGFSKDNTSTFINGIYTDITNNASEALSELGVYVALSGKDILDFCNKLKEEKGYIVVNKNTNIGIFNEWSGTCGYPDKYLEKDFVFPIDMIRNIQIEGVRNREHEYTIDDVFCGLVGEFWAENSLSYTSDPPELIKENIDDTINLVREEIEKSSSQIAPNKDTLDMDK